MEHNRMQRALEILVRLKDSLMETLVDDLICHEDDDILSFSIQEIEDRFAIRIGNLNTLITALQDQMHQHSMGPDYLDTSVYEVNQNEIEDKIQELTGYILPEELLHLSVVPATQNKYLIIVTVAS